MKEPLKQSIDHRPNPSQWLDEHGDALFQFAIRRVTNRQCAEDLVQETLVKGLQAYDKFRHESSVRTWLFCILRNEIHSFYRRRSRRDLPMGDASSPGLDQLLHPELSNARFSDQLERAEFWQVVRRCLQEIPEHLRVTFLSRLTNPDEKVDNLCQELGISASNFSVRLFRTRLLLRHCLESHWLQDDPPASSSLQ